MKEKLGVVNCLYPTLTVLVGATVRGKPNFTTVSDVGIMTNRSPYPISLGMTKVNHTNHGIKENKTFSVNIPSEDLVVETDYCGMVSGKETDKSTLFEVFYGELENVPMIGECLINMEIRLVRILDFTTHDVFVGEIVQTYCDNKILSGGKVDLGKLRPLLFDRHGNKYRKIGEEIAECYKVGKVLKKK